jgi:glycosyltransferase involved in cell wall biosynthesis
LALTQKIRAMQIARQIAKDAKKPDDPQGIVDIVHVLGGGAWGMGRELARLLGAGLALEIWRAGLADQAKNLNLSDEDRAMFLVPERAFEKSMHQTMPDAMIRCVPWGAQIPEQPVQVFREDKMFSVVLMSTGRQHERGIAAFEGIADAIAQRDDVMIFANQEVVERAGLWSRVKSRKLENRFTVIDRCEDRRDLMLRCDMMVYPDTLHEERTLLLDAMGSGLVLIASRDEQIQPLSDDSGVILVERGTREHWAEEVRSVIESQDYARETAERSRAYIRTHRRSALQVEALSDAYNDLVEMLATQRES